MAGQGDVRMRGFVERTQIDVALEALERLVRPTGIEAVGLVDALGRTLAVDAVSAVDVPAFAKSAVDGYGIRAEAGFGASPTNPLGFALVGEVLPGAVSARTVGPGEAVRIMTGGPIPRGVTAVVMAEQAEERAGKVFVTQALPPGKNVVPVAEDVARGDVVVTAGRVLGPFEVGALASLGIDRPQVRRRPVVAIATTGNELVEPHELAAARPGAVVNSNSYVIDGLARRLGAETVAVGIVRDDLDSIRALVRGFRGDLLVTTGGTSVGQEDYLPVVVAELGEVVVHGLSIRPGGPVGFGRVGERLIFLLPGNPVAAAVGFDVLVRPCLQWMLGQPEARRNPRARGRLSRKVVSALNRIDFVRVRVRGDVVEPVAGGAGVLTSLTRADGFVMVPKDLEGYDAGADVEVWLFERG